MNLNKFLFPAPSCQYDAKTFEKELIFIPRTISQKDFKIDRKENESNSAKKKPPSVSTSNKFMGFFKHTKTNKNTPDQPEKGIHSLNIETNFHKKSPVNADAGLESPNLYKEDEPKDRHFGLSLSCLQMHSQSSPTANIKSPKKMSYDAHNEEAKREDEKSKRKKKKKAAACLGFLPKLHKDKKIALEIIDGSHEIPASLKFGVGPALRNLGPDIADAIIHQSKARIDLEKESSSDSEDEAVTQGKKTVNIPCLYLKSKIRTQKTILYFHGNGEDLKSSYDLLQNLKQNLLMNIIAVEYPGYGIYHGSPSERKILIDAEVVYNYMVNELKIKQSDIFIFGRSIGSGPATWLASVKTPGMLILMCPFTSVRAVAKHLAGSFGKFLVKERFKNSKFIQDVQCPVFFIHGKKDTLIPLSQTTKLFDVVKGKKQMYVGEEMTHCDFDFFEDLTAPLTKWFKELDVINFKSEEDLPSEQKADLGRNPMTEILKNKTLI